MSQNTLEYKLYYDASGHVITYSTEKLSGNYIVITREQYAEARSDVIVKDNQIIRTDKITHTYVLEKSIDGMSCSKYDINILDNSTETTRWKLIAHEII